MKKTKFKVGDIVRGISRNYRITDVDMTKGEVVSVSKDGFSVKVLEHRNSMYAGSVYIGLYYEDFTLVQHEHNWKVVIIPDGNKTIGKLYEGDKVVKEVTTKKSLSDEYSKEEAIKVIAERLTAPERFNGKVVCVACDTACGLTVGKIYTFKDGISKNDIGGKITCQPVNDVKHLNSRFIRGSVKFIEVVE